MKRQATIYDVMHWGLDRGSDDSTKAFSDRENPLRAVLRSDLLDSDTRHLLVCDFVERALAQVKRPDPCSVKAIAVKRAWVAGYATDQELTEALVAARKVAGEAGQAATRSVLDDLNWDGVWDVLKVISWVASRIAAWTAIQDAAWLASGTTAGDVAWVIARDAAWIAAWTAVGDIVWAESTDVEKVATRNAAQRFRGCAAGAAKEDVDWLDRRAASQARRAGAAMMSTWDADRVATRESARDAEYRWQADHAAGRLSARGDSDGGL